jgi:hypothetical protein
MPLCAWRTWQQLGKLRARLPIGAVRVAPQLQALLAPPHIPSVNAQIQVFSPGPGAMAVFFELTRGP